MNEINLKNDLDEEQPLPIDPGFPVQMSHGTIRNLCDAIVELITNSDDSYKRIEEDGIEPDGTIILDVRRLKYGKCEMLGILDFAEGMTKDKLKENLTFAGESSGFTKGKSVRGFFGRGLKEAILALGDGEIYSIKDEKLSRAILWSKKNRAMHRPPKESYTPSEREREQIGIIERNGTSIKIIVKNEKMKCPDFKTLRSHVSNHYTLRDINSSRDRNIILRFESPEKGKLKLQSPISYKAPKGKKILEKSITIPDYKDNFKMTVYESEEQLESPYNNPFARAGFLIKTDGAIVDNQLFKFQLEKAAYYFFGEIVWKNLSERLRRGESLLDLNRVGIEWKHDVCLKLQHEVEKTLEPFVLEKKKELEVKPKISPSEKMDKVNKKICSLLNRLAKDHFSELPPSIEPSEKIEDLTIKPPYANLEIDKARLFSVYAPISILKIGEGPYHTTVESNNPNYIQVLNPVVGLTRHSKNPILYNGYFRVIGRIDKEEAMITCRLSENIATANVKVAPPGKIGKRKKVGGAKEGYFSGIKSDLEENPDQRVRYDTQSRTILIFVNFPGVKEYFKENLDFKREESRLMYAELIGEAFCRFTAIDDIEKGNTPTMSDDRDAIIGAYTLALNKMQKKYLYQIHEEVLKMTF